MKIELVKGQGIRPWYLRGVAKNGEILFSTQHYATKWNAKRAARKNFPQLPLVEVD